MTSPIPPTTGKAKVESLVTAALKEAMEKRKLAKEGVEPSELVTSMVEEATSVSITEKKKAALAPNQVLFSELLNVGVLPQEDFPVTVFSDYKWNEAVASLIPGMNHDYVFDIETAAAVLRGWELGNRILAYGPTGAGKSSLIQQLCAFTRRPFVRVNCSGDMDSSMIFGQLIAQEGSTIWVDGPVTEAAKYGAVFAWDEWDVTPPEISMGLQWLLEDDGKLMLKEKPGAMKDKMIDPHENFRLVAIGNTQGQGDDSGAHAGTNVQNSASLDRFGTAVYIDYLKPAEEEKMIQNKFKVWISKKDTKELVKFANLVRQGYKSGQLSLTISPRTLFNICKSVTMGDSLRRATKYVYLNKLNETQRKVAEELFTKIFGTVA